MTELEKMKNGLLFCVKDAEVQASLIHAKAICAKLMTMTINDENYRETMEDLIPGFPKTAMICPPFHCDHGSSITIGEHTFINYNCTMLDGAHILIGKYVQIGPNCSFYTPQHPMDYIERREPVETGHPITIGDDTWLGGNVTVCPGVTIGARCIIGAGSVVVHDIPNDCMAVGNPAVVKKKLK